LHNSFDNLFSGAVYCIIILLIFLYFISVATKSWVDFEEISWTDGEWYGKQPLWFLWRSSSGSGSRNFEYKFLGEICGGVGLSQRNSYQICCIGQVAAMFIVHG